MREVLLTVQVACSELADMRLLLHGLTSRLPADVMQQARPEEQADQGVGAEQMHASEDGPSRVEPNLGSSDHYNSSTAAMERLQQKAEKWKARCHDLQRELAALSVETAARDAALQVVLLHSPHCLLVVNCATAVQPSYTKISSWVTLEGQLSAI